MTTVGNTLQIDNAVKLARAGIPVPPETLAPLFANLDRTKTAIVSSYAAAEQGCSDWEEGMPFQPETDFLTLLRWGKQCGITEIG